MPNTGRDFNLPPFWRTPKGSTQLTLVGDNLILAATLCAAFATL